LDGVSGRSLWGRNRLPLCVAIQFFEKLVSLRLDSIPERYP
jgi:hypothetical protein